MNSVNLLGHILVCLVARSTSVTPLGSTSSPQQSYQQYLKSLAGPKLGTTRAPLEAVAEYPAGSYEAALQAGAILYTKNIILQLFHLCQYVICRTHLQSHFIYTEHIHICLDTCD